jgi:inorganic pyrophosphatase
MAIVDIIIEIPRHSKYKYNYENGVFKIEKKLICPAPENYGFIENTTAPDNAPLDVIVLTNKPLKQGYIKTRIVGAIMREDKDDKIIAVPIKSKIKTIHDVSTKRLDIIIKTWTGHVGQAPLKRIADVKEAIKIVEKYKN